MPPQRKRKRETLLPPLPQFASDLDMLREWPTWADGDRYEYWDHHPMKRRCTVQTQNLRDESNRKERGNEVRNDKVESGQTK